MYFSHFKENVCQDAHGDYLKLDIVLSFLFASDFYIKSADGILSKLPFIVRNETNFP